MFLTLFSRIGVLRVNVLQSGWKAYCSSALDLALGFVFIWLGWVFCHGFGFLASLRVVWIVLVLVPHLKLRASRFTLYHRWTQASSLYVSEEESEGDRNS